MKITVIKSETPEIKEVVIREPLVSNMVESQRVSEGNRIMESAALIAQICTFDGKQLTTEDVLEIPVSVFMELQTELISKGLIGSAELLSSLLGKDALV